MHWDVSFPHSFKVKKGGKKGCLGAVTKASREGLHKVFGMT